MSTEMLIPVVQEAPLDDLHPDSANPRRISNDELEALTRSIREFGLVQPIVARRDDGMVIGGHQRLVAARKLGMSTVPVIYLDVSLDQARLLNLAMNRISGEWEEELLAQLIDELNAQPGVDLSLSGFDEDELGSLLRSLGAREKREREETFDLAAALEGVTARTQPGEIWSLGAHRLMCGDATRRDSVARLLSGVRPAIAFTDPPYNVDLGEHGGQSSRQRRRKIANDCLTPEEWATFVRGWGASLLENVDGAIYVCMSTKEWGTMSLILQELGGHWSDTIIWAKDRFVLGRADYQRQYEPIWYGWKEGLKRRWYGRRDQADVWQVARPSASDLHPTTKPLELVERALTNSSSAGDAVLDLFLGSGTTLVACERTGRTCLAMELDPHYCDVAVARWEAFTGDNAIRTGSA